jgi:U3 small nucleolar RNA-associated protein 7
MTQNSFNAIITLGHHNGCVTLWNPNSNEPLAKILCHKGPINSIAINREGRYMATSGNDGTLKIWDIRTYKELQNYYIKKPIENIDISQKGILSISFGPHVQIFKDYVTEKSDTPYMIHKLPKGGKISSIKYCPYEDILGIGHSNGFSSIIVPGSGEPNFDTFEANPFENKKQRREGTIQKVLEKLSPDTITLDPDIIGNVTSTTKDEYFNDLKLEFEANNPGKEYVVKEKKKMRGRNSISNRIKKKKIKIVEEKKKLLEEKLDVEVVPKDPYQLPDQSTSALERFKK